MEEIRKSLYESYKWLYEEAIKNVKECLRLAKIRREDGHKGWSADWLESANVQYKLARRYKCSMNLYAN